MDKNHQESPYHASRNHEQTGVAAVVFDKVGFKLTPAKET